MAAANALGRRRAGYRRQGTGAAITETLADGTTSVWGTITQWEPPYRVAFTWHAGTAEAEATRVEVTGYDSGWEPVIGRFAEIAGGVR